MFGMLYSEFKQFLFLQKMYVFCVYPAKCRNNSRSQRLNKGNNKITELRTILQRESQNS